MLAEPARPTEPATWAAMSEMMSPYRLDVTITSRKLGLGGHPGRADVDDLVLGAQVGVLRRHPVEDLVEQAVGDLHDVVLGHAGDLAAAVSPGVLESVADDGL